MAIYKLFTWNMQRAQSVSQYNMASSPFASSKDNQIRERYRVLKRLVDWADFGFIIEPGQDIRTNLNNFSLPGLQRNFLTSQLQDNQTDASACRPVVYSKTPFVSTPDMTELYVGYLSGAQKAHRYPAAGIVKLRDKDGHGNKKLLKTFPSTNVVNGYHLSDHCPVTMKLRIAPFRERVNKADIVTGSRARKKSTNWKYQ